MYRMTMEGVYDMNNKDSGDVLGDTSFVVSKRVNAYQCRTTLKGSPLCVDVAQFSGDDSNSTDLVAAFTVEVDGQWGPYLPCNPKNTSKPLGAWECSNDIFQPPKDWPQQCKAAKAYGFSGNCFQTPPTQVLGNVSEGECCAAASEARPAKSYQAFTYFAANRTCRLQPPGRHLDLRACPAGTAGFITPPRPPACACPRVFEAVGRYDHGAHASNGDYVGLWYSNPHNGECTDGHTVGDGSGCTWRVVERQKMVNASCMYKEIDAAVVARNRTCFGACPQPQNVTSTCFLGCYTDTTSRMSNAELTSPWRAAFAGACPEFKP
jgi:hypothetical protein